MTAEVLLAPMPSQPVHAGARKPICDQGAIAKKLKKDGAVLGLKFGKLNQCGQFQYVFTIRDQTETYLLPPYYNKNIAHSEGILSFCVLGAASCSSTVISVVVPE